MLCGHTHGGQVVVPLLGAPIVPVRDRRYVAGLNQWRERWIYTTRGVGSLYGIRFGCRPEVSILSVT
jgi:predicted MPP superfamily phosphohydrolase